MEEPTVRAVARRAGLDPDGDAVRRYAGELREILDRIRELGSAAEPEEGLGDGNGTAGLRPDVPDADPMSRSPAEMAPDWRDGFFVVPRPASIRTGDGGREG